MRCEGDRIGHDQGSVDRGVRTFRATVSACDTDTAKASETAGGAVEADGGTQPFGQPVEIDRLARPILLHHAAGFGAVPVQGFEQERIHLRPFGDSTRGGIEVIAETPDRTDANVRIPAVARRARCRAWA